MNRFVMCCVFWTLILPAAALGDEPADPDSNILGLYFDTEGTQVEAWADPFEPLDMYVVLTRPTFDTLHGIEFGVTIEGPYIGNVGAVNGGGTMWPPDWDNFIYGWWAPLPVGEATWLVHINGYYTDATGGDVTFRLHGSSPSSLPGDLPVVLLADVVLQQLGTPVAPGEVCAQINGEDAIIASEETDWGSVKSLYR